MTKKTSPPDRSIPSDAVRQLLLGLIDYAGLFPPAGLGLPEVAANYARYHAGPHSHALGRLVLPSARLPDLVALRERGLRERESPAWPLSVLVGEDAAGERDQISEFVGRARGGIDVVSVEAKIGAPTGAHAVASLFPQNVEVWLEPPASVDPEPFIRAIAACGRCAKIRTGGIAPEAFPSAQQVATFLGLCRSLGVVAKATAGLHHPIRGRFPYTYEPASAAGEMFGFINVFLATAVIHASGDVATAIDLLNDSNPRNFRAEPDRLTWRNLRFGAAEIDAARQELLRSFGSCSFLEPLDGLQELGWIQSEIG
jgi:hypothetical protein